MKPRCCHYCGQALPEHRLGIEMRPIEGQLFDIILAAGPDGISNHALYERVMAMRGGRNPHTLNVHIYNINEKLSETGYKISGPHTRKLEKAEHQPRDALTPAQQKAFGL